MELATLLEGAGYFIFSSAKIIIKKSYFNGVIAVKLDSSSENDYSVPQTQMRTNLSSSYLNLNLN